MHDFRFYWYIRILYLYYVWHYINLNASFKLNLKCIIIRGGKTVGFIMIYYKFVFDMYNYRFQRDSSGKLYHISPKRQFLKEPNNGSHGFESFHLPYVILQNHIYRKILFSYSRFVWYSIFLMLWHYHRTKELFMSSLFIRKND